jgi:hypothetical protein
MCLDQANEHGDIAHAHSEVAYQLVGNEDWLIGEQEKAGEEGHQDWESHWEQEIPKDSGAHVELPKPEGRRTLKMWRRKGCLPDVSRLYTVPYKHTF